MMTETDRELWEHVVGSMTAQYGRDHPAVTFCRDMVAKNQPVTEAIETFKTLAKALSLAITRQAGGS